MRSGPHSSCSGRPSSSGRSARSCSGSGSRQQPHRPLRGPAGDAPARCGRAAHARGGAPRPRLGRAWRVRAGGLAPAPGAAPARGPAAPAGARSAASGLRARSSRWERARCWAARRRAMSLQCRRSSSVGAASCSRARRSRSSTSRWAMSREGSASAISSVLSAGVGASRRWRGSCCMCKREAAHLRMLRRRPGHQARQQHRRRRAAPARWCRRARTVRAGSRSWAGSADPGARVGPDAARTVELVEQRLAEAPRQAAARQAAQIGQRAQAHALQRLPVLAPGPSSHTGAASSRRFSVAQVGGMPAARAPRAARASSAAPCAVGALAQCTRWPSGSSAACSRRSSLQAAEVAQAGLHFEQHGVGRRLRVVGRLSVTDGVKASAACATLVMRLRSRSASAWPSTSCGASASAVARLSPLFTPSACARSLALTMRCASISAIGAGPASSAGAATWRRRIPATAGADAARSTAWRGSQPVTPPG